MDKIEDFQDEYLRILRHDHVPILERIKAGDMDGDIEQVLRAAALRAVELLRTGQVE